jgi:3-methyladenine DNA glycosylase AlkC
MKSYEGLKDRKGAARMADIPSEVLAGLNAGELETKTLVEWLAVDMRLLLKNILDDVGLRAESGAILKAFESVESEGVSRRLKGVAGILFDVVKEHSDRTAVYERLATHNSDIVRAWAAYMVTSDKTLDIKERLTAARRFASDGNMSVRETAWDSFRSYLAEKLDEGFQLLEDWVVDDDPNIRRCAVEATRPCGVWTAHISSLKENPEPGLRLLEHVKADPSKYVRTATANWLNDASKSRPDWVISVCHRWEKESPTSETTWIINRALRTIRKNNKGE